MKWKQTGKGESIHRYDLPLLSTLRVLDMSHGEIDLIADGDFDGFVYSGSGYSDHVDGSGAIDWYRYPAELVSDEQPVAADYADSAE